MLKFTGFVHYVALTRNDSLTGRSRRRKKTKSGNMDRWGNFGTEFPSWVVAGDYVSTREARMGCLHVDSSP